MTVCAGHRSWWCDRELSPFSSVPLSSLEHFSILQLIVLDLWPAADFMFFHEQQATDFTIKALRLHCTPTAEHQNSRQKWAGQMAAEHSAAFSWFRPRHLSQGLVEAKTWTWNGHKYWTYIHECTERKLQTNIDPRTTAHGVSLIVVI